MNCKNCGGVMELVDRRDYFACPYCSSFHFPDDAGDSPDNVRVLGTESDLCCPVCEDALVAGSAAGRRVSTCTRCRGVLATNDDFVKIVNHLRAERTGPPDEPRPINPAEFDRSIRCPSCAKRMDVHPYYGPGSVVVDTCHPCRLIWLDHGEIGVIHRAPGR
jgi:Zn-finger nucleic acid-binding protein